MFHGRVLLWLPSFGSLTVVMGSAVYIELNSQGRKQVWQTCGRLYLSLSAPGGGGGGESKRDFFQLFLVLNIHLNDNLFFLNNKIKFIGNFVIFKPLTYLFEWDLDPFFRNFTP